MVLEKKHVINEVGRWTRVGILSITTIAPLINILTARLREEQEKNPPERVEQPEKLRAASKALTDVLTQLQEHPYRQDLLKRGEELTDELKVHWNKFSGDVTEHSEELSQELIKRGRAAQKELSEQDQSFWIGLGFGIGIVATAGVTTYILLRKRFNNKEMIEGESENQPIQLASNNGQNHAQTKRTQGEIYKIDLRSDSDATSLRAKKTIMPQIEDYQNRSIMKRPTDANLVGNISTKQYYPVTTPLSQIGITNETDKNLIYFASEAEAREQGFTAAE